MVIANDRPPELGGPTAAPGLRASGLADGLRRNDVAAHVLIPRSVADAGRASRIPHGQSLAMSIIDDSNIPAWLASHRPDAVVSTGPTALGRLGSFRPEVLIYDHFAPKDLEAQAAGATPDRVAELAEEHETAIAQSDVVWVNGRRKLGAFQSQPTSAVLVEMPVSPARQFRPTDVNTGPVRAGIGGYAQDWSVDRSTNAALAHILARDIDVEAVVPPHWGQVGDAPRTSWPDEVLRRPGPLSWTDFGRWLARVDLVVDIFGETAERKMAMVTRTVVALAHGVPAMHGADSEVAPLIEEYDAGWTPRTSSQWRDAAEEASDRACLARKAQGARRLAAERFAPEVALEAASADLRTRWASG